MEMYGCKLSVVFEEYADNGRKAITLIDQEDGMPFCTATINVPEIPLQDDEVIIKNYSENAGILELLEEAGYIQDTGDIVYVGMAEANICKLLKSE